MHYFLHVGCQKVIELWSNGDVLYCIPKCFCSLSLSLAFFILQIQDDDSNYLQKWLPSHLPDNLRLVITCGQREKKNKCWKVRKVSMEWRMCLASLSENNNCNSSLFLGGIQGGVTSRELFGFDHTLQGFPLNSCLCVNHRTGPEGSLPISCICTARNATQAGLLGDGSKRVTTTSVCQAWYSKTT